MGIVAVLCAAALALSGCSITVPSPNPSTAEASTAPPSYAAPTVVAGHDAAAVAGAPMTFAAGGTLSPGISVEFSDTLGQPPLDSGEDGTPAAPEWTLVKNKVAGQTSYTSATGCKLAYWTTTNQRPLIVPGDDRASTEALMKYLLPSVMKESLTEAKLSWTDDPAKPGPAIDFLSFGTKAGPDTMASTVWARMLGTADTGLLVSLACPTADLLAQTTPKVMAKLSVAPPSS